MAVRVLKKKAWGSGFTFGDLLCCPCSFIVLKWWIQSSFLNILGNICYNSLNISSFIIFFHETFFLLMFSSDKQLHDVSANVHLLLSHSSAAAPQSVSPSCRISLILKIVPETRAASLWLSVYRGKHFFSACAFPKSLWENVTDCWQSRATLCSSHFQETPTNSCNKKRFVLLFSCVAPEETSANTDRRRHESWQRPSL